MQHKAAQGGFDWADRNGVWDKVEEELKEFRFELENNNMKNAEEELGDLIFSMFNAARSKKSMLKKRSKKQTINSQNVFNTLKRLQKKKVCL